MLVNRQVDKLIQTWDVDWQKALSIWGPYTRLRKPIFCSSNEEAAKEGLSSSFAMIRLTNQSIVVNLAEVIRMNLQDYGLEILAHEIGHHILAPANLTYNARIMEQIVSVMPTLEHKAPMVSNLFTDLLINNHLQRQEGLRISEVYERIQTGEASSRLWQLYMRIYELLWQTHKGQLGGGVSSEAMEGDAWLGARIVKVYSRDSIVGARRFAALLLPYLADEDDDAFESFMDTKDAGQGAIPSGLTNSEISDDDPHPAKDPLLTGQAEGEQTSIDIFEKSDSGGNQQGQCREPFEYGQLLKALGVKMPDHDLAMAYYRERALPYLVDFPVHEQAKSEDPLPEGSGQWEPGEEIEDIDWFQTMAASPVVVPGVTTFKREWGLSPGHEAAITPVDLDLYVDCSGSMPNPQMSTSFTALAGAILCLSALRAGASVQVTLWSGANQFHKTKDFVRNEQEILRVLTGYLGGGTAFPIHVLRQTHCEQKRSRSSHIVILSDEGVTTLFDTDEKGNNGWDVARQALERAGTGGTMVLNLPWQKSALPAGLGHFWDKSKQALQRAEQEQGWNVYSVSSWEDMVEFARSFSQKIYASNGRAH